MNTASQMSQMKVYAVIAGIDYEGEQFHTLRLFDCKSAADAYKEELEAEYDYALMETREVCMESAIPSLLNTKDGITTPW